MLIVIIKNPNPQSTFRVLAPKLVKKQSKVSQQYLPCLIQFGGLFGVSLVVDNMSVHNYDDYLLVMMGTTGGGG